MREMELVSQLAASVLAALAVYMLRQQLSRVLTRGSDKEILIREKNGRERLFYVRSTADPSEIRALYTRELAFEHKVFEILSEWSKNRGVDFHPGRFVDFIGQIGDKKIAVEAKTSLDSLTFEQVRDYLRESPQIQTIFVVSGTEIPEWAREMEKASASNRVRFLYAPSSESIRSELKRLVEADIRFGLSSPDHFKSREVDQEQ